MTRAHRRGHDRPGVIADGTSTIRPSPGDRLGSLPIAGLQSFTPPPDATTWRDELVAAVENGDADEVQAKVEMIGSDITLEFC